MICPGRGGEKEGFQVSDTQINRRVLYKIRFWGGLYT